MKKLLLFLTFLPLSLLAQEPPIERPTDNYFCTVEAKINPKTKKDYKFTIAQSAKQEVDAVEYLLSTDLETVIQFLENFSQSGQTTIFSSQNAIKAAQYFKENIIQLIDINLSDKNPEKFIKYFKMLEYHAFYQSSVSLSESYISELLITLEVLYNSEKYWLKSDDLDYFRWFATLLLDIPGHRADAYDLIMLNLQKQSIDDIEHSTPQVTHLSAISSIIWRGYLNGDNAFIIKSAADDRFINSIFSIIENDWFIDNNQEYIAGNFINILYPIFVKYDEYARTILPNYDLVGLANRTSALINSYEFGDYRHAKLLGTIANIIHMTGIQFDVDIETYKQRYYELNFQNTYKYDDDSIIIHTNISPSRVQKMYLALREARANFFKLSGDTTPLASDPNYAIDLYIFESDFAYSTYGSILFNVPTNNGGIYIENKGLYTFDRNDPVLTLEMLLKHEYVHYLDGRYNIEGDYLESDIYDLRKSVFWVEGLANFVAGASLQKGFFISEAMGYEIANNIYNNDTFTLKKSINTSYDYGFKMYAYSEATWGFLYNNKYSELKDLFKFIKEDNATEFFALLDQIANDTTLEPLYQEYLNEIKVAIDNNQISDPYLKSYDFAQPEIENDSITYVLNQSGIIDFEIVDAFTNPFKFVNIKKDTVVTDISELRNLDNYLEDLIGSLDKSLYNGFNVATAQIDSVDENLNIIYSLQIPVNGKITIETSGGGDNGGGNGDGDGDGGDDNGDGDNGNGDGDNGGGDPVDPVDPIITKIVAYPNPTVDQINITGLTNNSQVFIYNLSGQMLFNKTTSDNIFTFNMSRFPTGMYIVLVKTQKETKSLKIIKR
jgi:hypothetical protein